MLVDVVATIMKRTKINDYCALYSASKTTTGHYDDEMKVFYAANGDAYRDIKSSFLGKGDYAFDNLVETSRLSNEFYAPNYTLNDTIAEYSDECNDYAVLAVVDKEKNGKIATIYIDTKQILGLAREFGYANIDEPLPVIEAICRKFEFCNDVDNTLAEVCDLALAGGVPTERLERAKKIVNYYLSSLGVVLEILNSEIRFNELSSNPPVSGSEDDSDDMDFDEFDIEKIFNYVKGNVVGQDDALYRLVVEIARAYDSGREKDGILITGDSGVGKTLALTSLAECLNKPILIVDSTQLTMPGYVGKNIEEYLYDLYVKCGGNIDLAENAIIYFDEIDKKGSSRKSDISGQGVLNVLLKFLDGTTYDASDCKINPKNTVKISTSNMLVIAGGAFRDVYRRENSGFIGFESERPVTDVEPSCDDFVNKGMMTKEFMGRFPIVVHFKDLDKQDLFDILTTSNKSPLKREEKTFDNAGVRLRVTPAYLEAVTNGALKLKTGARGLKRIVSDTTWRPYAKIKSDDSYGEVVLDADTVSDNKVYQLIKKDKND